MTYIFELFEMKLSLGAEGGGGGGGGGGSSCVIIRLHTKHYVPRLPGSASKVSVVVWWWLGGVASTQLCGHTNFVLG